MVFQFLKFNKKKDTVIDMSHNQNPTQGMASARLFHVEPVSHAVHRDVHARAALWRLQKG